MNTSAVKYIGVSHEDEYASIAIDAKAAGCTVETEDMMTTVIISGSEKAMALYSKARDAKGDEAMKELLEVCRKV